MNEKKNLKNSLALFIIAFCFAGPLAFPLLWGNPHYSKKTKWVVSGVLTLLTLGLLYVFFVVMAEFGDLLKQESL